MADKGLVVNSLRFITSWMAGTCFYNYKRSIGPPDNSAGPEKGAANTGDVLMKIFLYCTPDQDWI